MALCTFSVSSCSRRKNAAEPSSTASVAATPARMASPSRPTTAPTTPSQSVCTWMSCSASVERMERTSGASASWK